MEEAWGGAEFWLKPLWIRCVTGAENVRAGVGVGRQLDHLKFKMTFIHPEGPAGSESNTPEGRGRVPVMRTRMVGDDPGGPKMGPATLHALHAATASLNGGAIIVLNLQTIV